MFYKPNRNIDNISCDFTDLDLHPLLINLPWQSVKISQVANLLHSILYFHSRQNDNE